MKDKKKCFYDENYENIKKKLEEANRNVRYRYVQGPPGLKGETGPTGPTDPKGENGPVTVNVGLTETVSSDEDAVVTNGGTDKNVVLNFKIPKGKSGDIGPTGPKGEIGPRGLPGEIGISQAVTVDGTETINPGEEAFVQDDFDSNIHHLTFYIPKGEVGDIGPTGPTGPTGPQGPAGASELPSYAMRFSYAAQDVNLVANTETTVLLAETGPAFLADYNSENGIDIKESGFYYISYYFNAIPKQDCSLFISAKADGINLAGSRTLVKWGANFNGVVSNSIIAALKADEVLTLSVESSENVTLSFNDSVDVTLSITKLH